MTLLLPDGPLVESARGQMDPIFLFLLAFLPLAAPGMYGSPPACCTRWSFWAGCQNDPGLLLETIRMMVTTGDAARATSTGARGGELIGTMHLRGGRGGARRRGRQRGGLGGGGAGSFGGVADLLEELRRNGEISHRPPDLQGREQRGDVAPTHAPVLAGRVDPAKEDLVNASPSAPPFMGAVHPSRAMNMGGSNSFSAAPLPPSSAEPLPATARARPPRVPAREKDWLERERARQFFESPGRGRQHNTPEWPEPEGELMSGCSAAGSSDDDLPMGAAADKVERVYSYGEEVDPAHEKAVRCWHPPPKISVERFTSCFCGSRIVQPAAAASHAPCGVPLPTSGIPCGRDLTPSRLSVDQGHVQKGCLR